VDKTPTLASLIARAIVHLNFNEPDQARDVLLDALTEVNFTRVKENSANGNRTAAA
jgi:hypothetical protein